MRYKYVLYYDGAWLRDSQETLGETYDTEEEAQEAGEMEIDNRIAAWVSEGCDYELELFEVIVTEAN